MSSENAKNNLGDIEGDADRIMLDRSRASRAKASRKDETKRIDDVKRTGRAPAACGPEIIEVAPGRGPVTSFIPRAVVPVGTNGFATVDRGYSGRHALKTSDVFTRMNAAITRGGGVPFLVYQVNAARIYAELSERHAAFGVKGSSAFNVSTAGRQQGKRDAVDRMLIVGEKLKECHKAIGLGVAKPIIRRGPRNPKAPGPEKTEILTRVLVDRVCLHGDSMGDVLRGHGWSDCKENIKAVYLALRLALERLATCF